MTLLVLLLTSHHHGATGYNYILLKGTGSSCVSVDAIPGATLIIKYHLPGAYTAVFAPSTEVLDACVRREIRNNAAAAAAAAAGEQKDK